MTSNPKGTYECPICGKDYPHQHTDTEVDSAKPRATYPHYSAQGGTALLLLENGRYRSATAEELVGEINRLGQLLERGPVETACEPDPVAAALALCLDWILNDEGWKPEHEDSMWNPKFAKAARAAYQAYEQMPRGAPKTPERHVVYGVHSDPEDAARYRWLRAGPGLRKGFQEGNLPWVVHVAREHGIPTPIPCNGDELDYLIDQARQSQNGPGGRS